MSSLRELEPDLALPRLASCGLPVIIGTRDRRAILAGSRKAISLYLSLFGLYRLIDAPVKAKLGTIVDPFSGDPIFLDVLGRWFGMNSGQLLQPFNKAWDLKVFKLRLITKSSPSNTISWKGLVTDLAPLLAGPLRVHVERYLRISGSSRFYQSMVQVLNDSMTWPRTRRVILDSHPQGGDNGFRLISSDGAILLGADKGVTWDEARLFLKQKGLVLVPPVKSGVRALSADTVPIGQLSFKKEAAGKLRVFAMVDV